MKAETQHAIAILKEEARVLKSLTPTPCRLNRKREVVVTGKMDNSKNIEKAKGLLRVAALLATL